MTLLGFCNCMDKKGRVAGWHRREDSDTLVIEAFDPVCDGITVNVQVLGDLWRLAALLRQKDRLRSQSHHWRYARIICVNQMF